MLLHLRAQAGVGIDARLAVQATIEINATSGPGRDGLGQLGHVRPQTALVGRARGHRVAGQQLQAMIEQLDRRAGRQRPRIHQRGQPGGTDGGEHDRLGSPVGGPDRVAEVDTRHARDAPDLIVTDGKVAGFHGAPEVTPITQNEAGVERQRRAQHPAIEPYDAKIGVARTLSQQAADKRTTRRRRGKQLRQMRHTGQKAARIGQQAIVLTGRHLGHGLCGGSDILARRLAQLRARPAEHHQQRHGNHQHRGHCGGPQTAPWTRPAWRVCGRIKKNCHAFPLTACAATDYRQAVITQPLSAGGPVEHSNPQSRPPP